MRYELTATISGEEMNAISVLANELGVTVDSVFQNIISEGIAARTKRKINEASVVKEPDDPGKSGGYSDQEIDDEKEYSTAEVAKITKLSEKNVRKYAQDGEIKARMVNRAWRFLGKDIKAYLLLPPKTKI